MQSPREPEMKPGQEESSGTETQKRAGWALIALLHRASELDADHGLELAAGLGRRRDEMRKKKQKTVLTYSYMSMYCFEYGKGSNNLGRV